MENYRKSSHCTYDIKYHLVWITKYRKPVITGQIAMRTRELIRMICQSNEVEILAGHVGSDHIHLLVSVPPHLSASKLVQYKRKYIQKTANGIQRTEQTILGTASVGKGIFCGK